jgi:hypothetical protein
MLTLYSTAILGRLLTLCFRCAGHLFHPFEGEEGRGVSFRIATYERVVSAKRRWLLWSIKMAAVVLGHH